MNQKIRIFFVLFTLFLLPALVRAGSRWTLEKSTLTYHVTHPLHRIEGVSHAAKGEGVCQSGKCEFLVAVPVKSFASGDSNRDLHMLQVTRGAEYPMVSVRFQLPESALNSPTIRCDLQVQFAGQTADYKQVSFQQSVKDGEHQIIGTIPTTVSDFKIDPPELLMIPIKNDMPVSVDMVWQKEK
jgi:hypothetical protein